MDSEVLDLVEEERRIKELKSLYYELNARPDSTTKLYNDKVVVTKGDIEQLDNMIREKLSYHVKDGKFGISNVLVSTSKHKLYSFNDFKLFSVYNWNMPEHINSITLVWDFFVDVAGYKRPQRHKLTVKITSGLKLEEVLNLIFSGKLEDIESIEEQQATIVAQMDFIESRLGQEFLNIVDEWVRTLMPAYSEKNKIILKLKKYRKFVAYYFNYALFIMLSMLSIVGFNYYIANINIFSLAQLDMYQFKFMVNYAVISILICLIVVNRGEVVAHKVFRNLGEYGESFVFRITKGDEVAYNRIALADRKSTVKIMARFIFSLILNVTCSIIASILYSKM